MADFRFRTEDIRPDEILNYFVETSEDRKTIELLKSHSPVILEGSRGTGKSFLLRVAEAELNDSFGKERVLPVYVSFSGSSLICTDDPLQFRHWMLARLCRQIVRTLRQRGLMTAPSAASSLLAGGYFEPSAIEKRFDDIILRYEASYRNPGGTVSAQGLPTVEDLRDSVEDFCRELTISRFCILFDEATHIFRPDQQRHFFTLFRDLRSPYISCNAAVYPGVTSYGANFQMAHDATLRKIERDVHSGDYTSQMREIAFKQAEESLRQAIGRYESNFKVLAYAATGNPRVLLKTLAKCPRLTQREVDVTIKDFYRSDVWGEHSGLATRYVGHKALIDWGRDFIENHVLPRTKQKNDQRVQEGRTESTCYFWVHRDAPEPVREALRLLSYTGIVQKAGESIRGTRSEIGTRYSVNIGGLLAIEPQPTTIGLSIIENLSIMRFTEFGANHPSFQSVKTISAVDNAVDFVHLRKQLDEPLDVLDLTDKQKSRLFEVGLKTVGDVLTLDEHELEEKVTYVGPVRARRIKNAATAAVLEYLSG